MIQIRRVASQFFSGKPEGPVCLSCTFIFRNERNWVKKNARFSEKLVNPGLPGLQIATGLQIEKENSLFYRNNSILKNSSCRYIACFSSQSLMFRPHIISSIITDFLPTSLAFNNISVTKFVLVLFLTFSNANRLKML